MSHFVLDVAQLRNVQRPDGLGVGVIGRLVRVEALESPVVRWLRSRACGLYRDQSDAQVTDLCEQSVEVGLVGDGAGEAGRAVTLAGQHQAVEPG